MKNFIVAVIFGVSASASSAALLVGYDFTGAVFTLTSGSLMSSSTAITGTGGRKQGLSFLDGDNVGQALDLGRFDEIGHGPGLAQHVLGVELEAIQIQLDVAP